ncbi:MAG: c-type cytochrome [Dehalococcoidia bacterium]|nr:c-type cytochrome [Dehalococcoidia bacterium]
MRASKSRFTVLLGLVAMAVAMAVVLAACEATSGFAALAAQPGASVPTPDIALVGTGRNAALRYGCLGCHSLDGSSLSGPTWKGLYGRELAFTDGTRAVANDKYLDEAIKDPLARVIQGYAPVMPPKMPVSDEEVRAIIAFIKSVK